MRGPKQSNTPSADEPDPSTWQVPTPIQTPAGHRKKGTGVRPWLLLDSTGQSQVVEAGKHAIMRRTGLTARDLRILDPLLSYPSAVLGRERAIVINLEHIKAIITAHEVLLLNSRDPSVMPFVEELRRRIICHYHANKSQEQGANDFNWPNLYTEEQGSRVTSPKISSPSFRHFQKSNEKGKPDKEQELENQDGSKVLPFEFVALEACLEAACSCLEKEAKTLEQEAHPALDKLTSKINTLNLERVRQIKSRLVAITGRVQKVRDELEHLLDDEEDMAEMYLTDKLAQQLDNSSTSSINERDDVNDAFQPKMDDRATLAISFTSNNYGCDIQDNGNPQGHLVNAPTAPGRGSHGSHTSATRSAISKQLGVEELEMLLEAYFVQIDGTLNNLSTLREYVDDTEDYINILLDDKQNHLLQMGVLLTTATLVLTVFVVLVGVLGMNIRIQLFNTGMPQFLWTVGGGATGTVLLYAAAVAWYKHKRLI